MEASPWVILVDRNYILPIIVQTPSAIKLRPLVVFAHFLPLNLYLGDKIRFHKTLAITHATTPSGFGANPLAW
jgi:hypothetical protein